MTFLNLPIYFFIFFITSLYISKCLNIYQLNLENKENKEKLHQKAHERYQNLSKKEKKATV